MRKSEENRVVEREFGAFSSNIYSFFASRSPGHRKIYARIVEDVSKKSPERVLDIGCGPGIALGMLAETLPEARLFGIDPSPSMIGIARKMIEKNGLSDRVIVEGGDSSTVPFDGVFDIIFTSLSFHHWPHGEELLPKILKKLAHHGSLFIYENFVDNPKFESEPLKKHGISMEYVKHLNFEGFERTVDIYQNIIIVNFTRID